MSADLWLVGNKQGVQCLEFTHRCPLQGSSYVGGEGSWFGTVAYGKTGVEDYIVRYSHSPLLMLL